ncbi:MAG: hypothetical protein QOE87_188 [Gaiellales bacterium]|nr:hypothetical protein [Gaiellales bacterium]
MRKMTFQLSIDEGGACHGYSSEGAELLHARHPGDCIVEVQMPLPAGSASATVSVIEQAVTDAAAPPAAASAWLALDDDGGCIAFTSSESGLPETCEAADRYAEGSGLHIAVVRVDVPLPAGSAAARITLT